MAAPPDHWHVLIGLAAIRAGKDLYLEKPLGATIEEGKAIRKAVLASDRGSAGAALARHGGVRLPCPGQGDDAWIAAIRDVVRDPAATRSIGAAAAASIQSLSWRHSARQIAARLRQLASQDRSAP